MNVELVTEANISRIPEDDTFSAESEAETEVAEDDCSKIKTVNSNGKILGTDDEYVNEDSPAEEESSEGADDDEDEYWASRRRRRPSPSNLRPSPPFSTVATSVSDADESDSGGEWVKDSDGVRQRVSRKSQHAHRVRKSSIQMPRHKHFEVTPERRKRGRPRKDSLSEKIQPKRPCVPSDGLPKDYIPERTHQRRRSKGRTACQDPNRTDKAGRTKLFLCTSSGHLDKVKELVARGANVNHKDNAGWTPLHEASLKSQYEIAKYLIECGADVNARGFGDDTPLHDACSTGCSECVQLLTDAGADVFALNSDKQTPLDVCDDIECEEIVKRKMKLLDRLVARDDAGRTTLHRACAEGRYEEAAALVKQGANTNAKDKSLWTPLHEASHFGHLAVVKLLVEHGSDINHPGHEGNTALHSASRKGRQDIVQYMVDVGADVDICNDAGKTAYDVAEIPAVRRILAARVDELRKQRAVSDAIDEVTFISHSKQRQKASRHRPVGDGDRQLSREERKIQAIMRTFEALEQNQTKRPRRIRQIEDDEEEEEETQTDILTAVRKKKKGLHQRTKSCSAEAESRECSVGAEPRPAPKKVDATKLDPRKKDTSGRTHLHKWSIRGDISVVETLLKAGANPNETDNAGWTPLHEAALRGQDAIVQLLLENGANANSKGADSDTPLHDATENSHYLVVELLLRHGANPHACNAKGSRPLDIAIENGDADIEQALRKAIAKFDDKKAARECKTSEDRKRSRENVSRSSESKRHKDTAESHGTVSIPCIDIRFLNSSLIILDMDQPVVKSFPKKRRLVLAADLECRRRGSQANTDDKRRSNSPPSLTAEADVKIKTECPVKSPVVAEKPACLQERKAHARKLSGMHLPKKNLYALHGAETPPDGPHTPIPTPPPEQWQSKIKEEKDDVPLSLVPTKSQKQSPGKRLPLLSDAIQYLPLYTVQLLEEGGPVEHSFYVVDLQVSLLLGVSMEMLWQRYPSLYRRLVLAREKERLWSPLATMICAHGQAMETDTADVKEIEKQRFIETKLYFMRLEQVVALIKKDYGYLSKSLITITLDIGYKDEARGNQGGALPFNTVFKKPPSYGLPPKFAMKLQKRGMLKFDNASQDSSTKSK
ncbi:hypothetical protein DFQ28_001633 [Apophysomyces sp. BC1034]|nr:hypothetical protein DFQ30_001952 [Apophysomyces sp. BC1015]KAG0180197.1 hypothetical protein DFQ29_001063 [Apophysomyces sp. BC1021]KAG0190745.1 hypothetical protein DFQ28_001633 [Apophysomyces sp. BC1034]